MPCKRCLKCSKCDLNQCNNSPFQEQLEFLNWHPSCYQFRLMVSRTFKPKTLNTDMEINVFCFRHNKQIITECLIIYTFYQVLEVQNEEDIALFFLSVLFISQVDTDSYTMYITRYIRYILIKRVALSAWIIVHALETNFFS